jgi:hypothetical protein
MQIEGQQVERNQSQQEKAALAKLDRIKLDQGKRADDLERDAAEAESKVTQLQHQQLVRKEKKRQDYAFQHQVDERSSMIPGCPEAACHSRGAICLNILSSCSLAALSVHSSVGILLLLDCVY